MAIVLILFVAITAKSAGKSAPITSVSQPSEILQTLQKDHPRLFISHPAIKTLQEQVKQDPVLKKQIASLCKQADRIIDEEPVKYILIGPRLLDKSRKCLDRVSTLGFAWQMTGEKKYADRALKELEAVSAFPDWHPAHFLDTAEMSCAAGIGYDWLYSYMNKSQRDTIRKALTDKGLTPGIESYRGKASYKWWTTAHHNWSQVCNGGLAVGALAIADEEPAICAEILESGLKAVQGAMANFGPDGSWNEGPGYWGYTTMYTAFYLEAMQTALGTMHDLDRNPALAETGIFKIYFTGPTGNTFNFADAHEHGGQAPQMFWLAKTFNKPIYAWEARQKIVNHNPFNMIWYSPAGTGPAIAKLPLNKYFRRDNVAFFQSAWEKPDAIWVGFKGGDNMANHAHLDIGSFVLDALGERWAVDLGSDDYNLPGYFGKERWSYFRLKTESHNTLLIDNANQNRKAEAPIIAFSSNNAGGSAVADLSKAYPMTKSVKRGISLCDGKCVMVEDEVHSDKPVDVLWGMITMAKVTINGANAVLEQKGKTLYAQIISPSGAVFQTMGANPKPPEHQQPDATKLAVKLPSTITNLTLVVLFSIDKDSLQQHFKPLAQWPGQL